MDKLLSFIFFFGFIVCQLQNLAQSTSGNNTAMLRLVGPSTVGDFKEVIDEIRSDLVHPVSCNIEVDERLIHIISKEYIDWIGVLDDLNSNGYFVALLSPIVENGMKVSHEFTLENVRNRWAEYRGISIENALFISLEEWNKLTIRARAELERENHVIIE